MSTNPSMISTTNPPTVLLPRRRRWGWLRTLIVFAAGFIAGAAVCVIVIVHRVEFAIHHPESAPPRITQYLRRKLDLTETQQVQVLAILKQRQLALQSLRRDIQPRVEGQLGTLKQQIDGVLTPEQQAKWESIFDTAKDRWLPAPPPAPTTMPIEKP